jgi:L,D-transpeptidase-like protein
MSRHRAAPPRRHAVPPPGRRRAEKVQPRYGRLTVLGASVSVTGIAMLGGVGVLPSVASGDPGSGGSGESGAAVGSVLAGAQTSPSAQSSEQSSEQSSGQPSGETSEPAAPPATSQGGQQDQQDQQGEPASDAVDADAPAVPEDSGAGRRIVFDQSDQRVWLIDEDDEVERTYLVSGSLYDNLDPGTYTVYSRSEDAVGIDDTGTMKYFVRFTQGDNGAAIGFHDIPVDDGSLVQTVDQLGTPQSHGCIRQEREDAIALWEFAPIGTEVDVTA